MGNNRKETRIVHIAECAVGVDKYLTMLFPMLKEHYKQFFICSQNYNPTHFKDVVDEVIQINMGRTMASPKNILTAIKIRRVIMDIAPDIIYCHSSYGGGLGRLATIGLKCKIVYNPHGWSFNIPYGIRPKLYRLIERLLAYRTDKIVAISDFEKHNALAGHVAKAEKFRVIYNGIDLEKTLKDSKDVNISRNILHIPDNAFLMGISARICETKAPDVFVKAASIVKKVIPEAYFLFIGDGELRNDVEKLICAEGMSDSFLITGWVDNPMPYIDLLDVGLLLSRWEGFGYALAEYMKLGKAIVATNICAIPNLITNGVNGILVPMDDYHAVADALITLYNNPSMRTQMGENGVKIVDSKFDVKRVGTQHIELFEELLAQQ